MKQITFALIATAIGLILAFSGSAAAIYAASHSPMGGPDNPDKFPSGFPHQKVSKQCSMDGFCGAAELPEHHSNKHHSNTQTTISNSNPIIVGPCNNTTTHGPVTDFFNNAKFCPGTVLSETPNSASILLGSPVYPLFIQSILTALNIHIVNQ